MPIIANFAYRDLETRPRSHSLKVIDFGTNGKRVYTFLLVINSNCIVLSCTVSEIWRLKIRKSPILPTPPSFNAPARRNPTEFRDETCCRETRWIVLPYGESFIILTSTVFTARCTLVQSAVLRSHVVCLSVCPSVTLVNCDHIGWNSSKIISPLVSLGRSLFVTPTWRVCSKGNTPKFGPKVTHPLLI